MAMRDKLTRNVQPFLDPDEIVRWVFPAAAAPSPMLIGSFGAVGYLLFVKPRIVVVTDKGIVLIEASKSAITRPKNVLARGPHVRLGPPQGAWARINLGDKLFVHRRFHKDIEAADAAFAFERPSPTGAA